MKRSVLSRNFLPRLESMEARECPAVMCFANAGTLQIVGDRTDNMVEVSTSSAGVIDVVGDGAAFHFAGIQSVSVTTGDGNDRVAFRVDEASKQVGLVATADLGGGDDAVHLQVKASQAFAMTPGAGATSIDVTAKGSAGADRLSAEIASTSPTSQAMLLPAVKLAYDGGVGADTMSLTARGVYFRGKMDVNYAGGDGNDTITQNFAFNNLMAAANLNYVGGGGDDRIDTRFDASGLRSVYNAPVNLNVQGQAGSDTLNFVLGGSTTPSATGDKKGDAYNPVVNVAFNFTLDGGDGNDVVAAKASVAVQGAGKVNAKVLGSAGDDDLTLDVGAVPAASLQAALIDGGEGIDTHHSLGNVVFLNCEL